MTARSFLLLPFLFLPSSVEASIILSEVMYDLDGADSGREWVEITNDGTSAVDLTDYKLYEATTNHTLTLTQGVVTLPAGESAVIADDTVKFLIDWPTFTGILFDSSFSLSNTGETLVIRRADLTDEDSATYDSTMGGAGDGTSLSRSGTTFVGGSPTPGSHPLGSPSPSPSPTPTPTPSPSPSPTPTPTPSPTPSTVEALAGEPTKHTVIVKGLSVPTVGADSVFEAQLYSPSGKAMEGARYVWSFGNGDTREGRSILYAYTYPGRYLIYVAASGFDGTATGRLIVDAKSANIKIMPETDGSIVLLNNEAREVAIGGWIIKRGPTSFTIPPDTVLLPEAGVRFAVGTTRLLDMSSVPLLFYPNGILAEPPPPPSLPPPAPTPLSKAEAASLRGEEQKVSVPPRLETTEEPEAVGEGPVLEEANAAAVILSTGGGNEKEDRTLWLVLALIGIILAGVSATLLVRKGQTQERIEIIEETD